MKKFNKLTILAGLAATATAITPIVAITSCNKNKQTEQVVWKDGWYAWENASQAEIAYSNTIDVSFTLKQQLSIGQTLSVKINKKSASGLVTIEQDGEITINGTDVLVPIKLNANSTALWLGDYATYDINFICMNGETKVWEHTVSDCYLVMFFEPTLSPMAREFHFTSEHNIDFYHEVKVSESASDIPYTATAQINTISRSQGVASDVCIVQNGDIADTKTQVRLPIKWNKTDGLNEGDTVTFNVKLTLALKLYPNNPVSFEFNGLKAVYK